jgi:uncharacterized membrane protein
MTIEPLWLDIFAFVFFVLLWAGYAGFAKKRSATDVCLASVMHLYRVQWAKALMSRENRIADISVIMTFERNMAFLGSSALIIIAGLLTLLGNTDQAVNLFAHIPFAIDQSLAQLELKIAILIAMFVYAFFKFSWAMRQTSFAAVIIAGAPQGHREELSTQEEKDAAERIARVVSMAGHHFNFGIRTYYFALAVITWFINSWVFMGATALVVWVLYRREFRSSVLHTLAGNHSKA